MALKYIWSPVISAAINARSVSNPFAVMPCYAARSHRMATSGCSRFELHELILTE